MWRNRQRRTSSDLIDIALQRTERNGAASPTADDKPAQRFTMTHVDIAQTLGTSRESITRVLTEFRRKDIAELRRSTLIIHNKPALERLVAA